MNIVFSSKALDRLPAKTSPYIVYHASGERGMGRLGVRLYTTGKKKFIYRHFVANLMKKKEVLYKWEGGLLSIIDDTGCVTYFIS